jgi:AmmeMemoRadiSam system protein A
MLTINGMKVFRERENVAKQGARIKEINDFWPGLKLSVELVRLRVKIGAFPVLSRKDQELLLAIARESIARALAGERRGRRSAGPTIAQTDLAGPLGAPSGAFVTIRIGHDLRGCIGFITSDLPLARVVDEAAAKAATEDPRFPPMTQSEFAKATVEISILSSLQKVNDVAEIRVGNDGLVIEMAGHRGLLLPQVATEFGWDRETFVMHTCRKAGLPADAWKDPGASIYRFSAEIVEEEVA